MTIKTASCPFCGNQQPIVIPTNGSYHCTGCNKTVTENQYQLDEYMPEVPTRSAFELALDRIAALEDQVGTLYDAVNDLQTGRTNYGRE